MASSSHPTEELCLGSGRARVKTMKRTFQHVALKMSYNQTGFSISTVWGLSLGWSPSPADWLSTVQAPSASREKS